MKWIQRLRQFFKKKSNVFSQKKLAETHGLPIPRSVRCSIEFHTRKIIQNNVVTPGPKVARIVSMNEDVKRMCPFRKVRTRTVIVVRAKLWHERTPMAPMKMENVRLLLEQINNRTATGTLPDHKVPMPAAPALAGITRNSSGSSMITTICKSTPQLPREEPSKGIPYGSALKVKFNVFLLLCSFTEFLVMFILDIE